MAVDLFLKIMDPPIDGECQKKDHVGEVDILSFSFGAHQTGSFQKGGMGGGAGKAEFTDVSILKEVDKASPQLFQACAAGTHFKKMLLTSQKAGDKPLLYYTVELGDVIVSSLTNSGSTGGDAITESLTFNVAQIKFTYYEQQKDGSKGAKSEAGYDIRSNDKI
jgi:type VI secretion system secreted protein Hcp